MRLFIIVLLLFFCQICKAQKSAFNDLYKELLNNHLTQDRFDYSSVSTDEITDLEMALLQSEFPIIDNGSDFHFLINVYNFLIIKSIEEHYPIQSVFDIPHFFQKNHRLGNREFSLDKLEKTIIAKSGIAFLHVLFNCGAKSCPPLQFLDGNFPLDEYIRNALVHPNISFFENELNRLSVSKIFFWYIDDFKSEAEIVKKISTYFPDAKIKSSSTLKYMEYDWSLNHLVAEEYLIYYPTKLYKKGGGELKIFNNYYTQSDNGLRSNYFSSFIQLQLGTNKNFNYGFDVKLRSVTQGDVGLFSALAFKNKSYYLSDDVLSFARTGISAIGPRVKYQPSKNNGNLNVLHSIYYVPIDEAEGGVEYGFFDFQNVQIFNNVFIEKEISVKRRLFFDIGFHLENIRFDAHKNINHTMQIQLPVTLIYSYFPNPKTTFYALGNVAVKHLTTSAPGKDTQVSFDGYAQIGFGAKYYLTDFLEVEALYTYFADRTKGRFANTFNIGLRFFKF